MATFWWIILWKTSRRDVFCAFLGVLEVPVLAGYIMAETDSDVVHCPTVGNKHWMFNLRLVRAVNRFAHFTT